MTLKLLSDVSKSSYLVDAEKNAGISFLERNQLQCDGSGLKFTFKNHDITVKIPEGALAIGEKIHVEVAVMPMYGPFQFLKGARLISPVVWLCPLEKNVHLKRPIHVTLPHILSGLTEEKAQYYQVQFNKANHNDYASGVYNFQPAEGSLQLFSEGDQSYAMLSTNHFCYICITAKDKPELKMDAGYCLTRAESRIAQWRYEAYFCVSYYLKTCLQVMEVRGLQHAHYISVT